MGASKATSRASNGGFSKPKITRTSPLTKVAGVPNASILSFFQKVGRPEESLFLENGQLYSENQDEDDIYDADVIVDESRFHETGSPVKKRRIEREEVANPETSTLIDNTAPLPSLEIVSKATKKKASVNPFLDSSDEEDEGDANPGVNGNSTHETEHEEHLSASHRLDQDSTPVQVAPEPTVCDPLDNVPQLHREGTSLDQDMAEFDDMDGGFDDDEYGDGEEYRMMRFMQEQARLEAEAAGEMGDYSSEDIEIAEASATKDSGVTASCPICNGSLEGVSADEATIHVNRCLDGDPTPIPTPVKPSPAKASDEAPTRAVAKTVDAPELGRRFARAAIARPGQANPIAIGGGGTLSSGSGSGSNSAFAKLMSGHAEDAAWASAAASEHASRGRPAYERTCPFYKIMPGLSICVDAFRYGAVEGCRAYFLSHFHSDHYIGLTASWTHGPIYCSRVTGSLVKSQLRTAAEYVVELEFEKTVPVPGTDGVVVTMIPANHCPGSSLFLFEKKTGGGRPQRILHCGDFRACPAHVAHPLLSPETVDAVSGRTKQQTIDVCYLDTTYLNPRYSFPPQQDVIRACAEVCVRLDNELVAGESKEWNAFIRRREGGRAPDGTESVSKFFAAAKVEDDDGGGKEGAERDMAQAGADDAFTALRNGQKARKNRLLVVCGTYSIGKERICKAIAQALGTKIFASPAKIRICRQLGDPELAALLTPDPAEAQVHMQMLMEIRAETLAEYLEAYRAQGFARIVGFRPSGWNYRPGSTAAVAAPAGSAAAAAAAAVAGGGIGASAASGRGVTANLAPTSLPTTYLLHGAGWRTRFRAVDLAPQRGSGKEALCFGVPYSEHSSFRELALFVMALRIERIVPTVNVGSEVSRRRMRGWLDRWMAERRKGGLVRVLVEEELGAETSDGDGYMWNSKDKSSSSGGSTANKPSGQKEAKLWDGKDGRGGSAWW